MNERILKNIKDVFLLLVSLGLVVIVHYLIVGSDWAMSGLNPNPILIVSILFSAYRGFKFSFLAAIISSITYFLLILAEVDFEAVETVYSLEYLFLPIVTIASSALVGDIQQRMLEQLRRTQGEAANKNTYIENLIHKNEVYEKELFQLKKRIVTDIDTVKSLHETARKLSSFNVEELVSNFLSVVSEKTNASDIVFYTMGAEDNVLEVFKAYPKGESESRDKRKDWKSDHVIAQSIMNRDIVTVKDFVSKSEYDKLTTHTLISIPVLVGGDIYGIITINKIPFLEFVPHNIKLIRELSLWLEHSLDRTLHYENLVVSDDADRRMKAYKYSYFLKRLDEELKLSRRYEIPLFVLKLTIKNLDKANGQRARLLKKFIIELVRRQLRKMDSVCLSEQDNEILVLYIEEKNSIVSKVKEIQRSLTNFSLEISEEGEKVDVGFSLSDAKSYIETNSIMKNFEEVSF